MSNLKGKITIIIQDRRSEKKQNHSIEVADINQLKDFLKNEDVKEVYLEYSVASLGITGGATTREGPLKTEDLSEDHFKKIQKVEKPFTESGTIQIIQLVFSK